MKNTPINKKTGQVGTKRHAKKSPTVGMYTTAIVRLGRKAGITGVSKGSIVEFKRITTAFLTDMLAKSYNYTRHSKRHTIFSSDVVSAAKLKGVALFGYNN